MDFETVVRSRRMVRSFSDDPVPAETVDRLLDLARRAPSAGRSQGTDFLVLEGSAQTASYWDLTLPEERRASFPWPGLLRAPVLVLPLADRSRYLDRYSKPDKAASGLGESEQAWAVPYWHIDTAMAAMTLLHGAVDVGLGALFFGIFENTEKVCARFGLPEFVEPIGTIALGWADGEDRASSSAGSQKRRPLESVIHRGQWLPSNT